MTKSHHQLHLDHVKDFDHHACKAQDSDYLKWDNPCSRLFQDI